DGCWRSARRSTARPCRSRPAASGWWPRCRDTPAACRAPAAAGSGSPCGCVPRRTRRTGAPRWPSSSSRGPCSCRHPACPAPTVERLESRNQQPVEPALERRDHDPADNLARERVGQQTTRRLEAEAAGAQVEDRVLFEPADRRSVSALDVIGKDLQLRLGVDHGILGQEQVLVGLLGVRLLSVLVYVDLAVEPPLRSPGEDALVELAAAAVRLLVVDPGVVVGVLAVVHEVEAIEGALTAFPSEHGVGV